MSKTILILGGAYVGVSSAHYILKHIIPSLPDPSSYQVILVSSSKETIVRPATPRAILSDKFFDQDKLIVPLKKQFTSYGDTFRFIHGTAKWLDHEQRKVVVEEISESGFGVDEIQLEYHALIIGTGSSSPSPLFALNAGGAPELKEKWELFRAALPAAKRIVIAGGGPVGVETAGELGEHLNGRAGWFASKLEDPKVKITVVTSAEKLLPELRPAIATIAEELLAKVGVEVVKGVRVAGVTPENAGKDNISAKTNVTLSNGEVLQADLYIPAYGTIPNTAFVNESLKASDGRLRTNKQTLRVEGAGPRVYTAGDASDYARSSIPIITSAIPVLCANLKRDLLVEAGEATGQDRLFTVDESEFQLVPIGQSNGVGAVKGFKLPSWSVWLIKGRDYFVGKTQGTWNGQAWAKEA
ncbi:hypothetical protein BDV18DRAFT_148256 [Aspergillus unguis]